MNDPRLDKQETINAAFFRAPRNAGVYRDLDIDAKTNLLLGDLVSPQFLLPAIMRLTVLEHDLVTILVVAAPRMVRRSHIMELLYPDPANQPKARTLDVHVCRARAKLIVYGVEIETRKGFGIWINAEGAARLRAMSIGA